MTMNGPDTGGRGAMPKAQGIDDVVVSGTTAPHDWDERIFAGRSTADRAARPAPEARPKAKPCEPGLARAMRAMQR